MLYILDKHCTTCIFRCYYYYSSHRVYDNFFFILCFSSLDEVKMKKKAPPRVFCDICDCFDLHDTEDCPTQTQSPDLPPHTTYHGSRSGERPYCDICEAFGHWTDSCNDDQTFWTSPQPLGLWAGHAQYAFNQIIRYFCTQHIYIRTSCTFPKWIRPNEGMLHLWNLNVMKARYISVINTVLCVFHCPVLIDLMMHYQQENWERFSDTLQCI